MSATLPGNDTTGTPGAPSSGGDGLWPGAQDWPSFPPAAGSEAAMARSLRRRRRQRRAAGAAVVVGAMVAGAGVSQAVLGSATVGSANAADVTLSAAQVEAKVDPALVDVVSNIDYGQAQAAGTGIVLTSAGEILTNNHVVEGATSITVTDVGNAKTYKATVVGYDAQADVAVLRLQGASGLATAALGSSASLAVGQAVVALGNAGGVGGTPSAATGTITALDQSISAADELTGSAEQLSHLVQTNAAIQPGDSGGPLVDMQGQVVAMDTAGSSTFQLQYAGNQQLTQGYAIPVNRAMSIVGQIQAGRASASVHIGPSAFLGVEVVPTSSYSPFGATASGAGVAGVISGTPAASAGLGQGDTITSVAGHNVSSSTSLRTVMDLLHPGQRVTVGWLDGFGVAHRATVTLGSGPTG